MVVLRVSGAGRKTPWYLRGTREGRLIACKAPWHSTLEKEGLLEAPRASGVQAFLALEGCLIRRVCR